jgi:hypothetical protein
VIYPPGQEVIKAQEGIIRKDAEWKTINAIDPQTGAAFSYLSRAGIVIDKPEI